MVNFWKMKCGWERWLDKWVGGFIVESSHREGEFVIKNLFSRDGSPKRAM